MAGCRQNLAGIERADTRGPIKEVSFISDPVKWTLKSKRAVSFYPLFKMSRSSVRVGLVATAWVRFVGAHAWVPLCSPSRLYLTEEEKTASRFHREPIVRFRWSTVCTEIKEPSCNNSPNPDQLIQRKRRGKVSVLCERRGCSLDKITQHYTRRLTAENRITKRETSKGRVCFFWTIRKLYLSMNTGLGEPLLILFSCLLALSNSDVNIHRHTHVAFNDPHSCVEWLWLII